MFKEFIDISQSLREGMPVFPGDEPFTRQRPMLIAQGAICNLSSFKVSMHAGTHVDAPLHFIDQGAAIEQLTLERFFGKARVLEFDSEESLEADALRQHAIQPGERILINIRANEAIDNAKQRAEVNLGLQRSAAELLVQIGVKLVGINCASIEPGWGGTYEVHSRLLGAGIVIVENLVLAAVTPGDYYLACFPIKLEGGEGAPVRAVLMR